MSVVARVRHQVTNGGKDHSAMGNSLDNSADDRYQRIMQENHQLKLQRNELQNKVKDLTTKFRRLVRDLKLGVDIEGFLNAPAVTTPRPGSQSVAGGKALGEQKPNVVPTETCGLGGHVPLHKFEAVVRERDMYLQQVIGLQSSLGAQSAAASNTGMATTLQDRVSVHEMQTSQLLDKQRLEQAHKEIARLQLLVQQEMNHRMQLQQAAGTRTSLETKASGSVHTSAADSETRELRLQLQHLQSEALQAKSNIEHLTRERDTLQMQLRLAREAPDAAGALGFVDPMSLLELQQDIQSKASSIAVLNNRLQYAQSQVGTLKQECERLLSELRALHTQHAETKKQLFDQEHEKAALILKSERVGELDMLLQHKQDELVRTEGQLLKMVERIQGVSREVEMSVRREVASRLAEAEQSRDEAERVRRAKERSLYDAEQAVAESKRKVEALSEEIASLKKELSKEREERKELAARNALLSGVAGDLGEDVHRAIALSTMKQRLEKSDSATMGHGGSSAGEARGILSMWEGLEWNEGWEAAKLRETLATAALDMELSDTRMQQLSATAAELQRTLAATAEERDVLFEENSALRRRISGIQTSLAKKQLQQYRAALSSRSAGRGGLIRIAVVSISSSLIGTDNTSIGHPTASAAAYFITVDGLLEGYEAMVSNVFYSLDDPHLYLEFAYSDVHVDEATVGRLRNATIEFQLHQCGANDTTTIIAYGEWHTRKLLDADPPGHAEGALLTLLSPSSGQSVASICFSVDCENVLLPVLLGAPLSSLVLEPAVAGRMLHTLRAVVGLRVQVFRLLNVPATVAAPYIYCTFSTPSGVRLLQDSVVETADHRARLWPTAPRATDNNNSSAAAPTYQMDLTPVDHKLMVDKSTIHALAEGVIVFVLFDRNSTNAEEHVGMVSVPLRPLLESSSASLLKTYDIENNKAAAQSSSAAALTLEVGLSWVCAAQ